MYTIGSVNWYIHHLKHLSFLCAGNIQNSFSYFEMHHPLLFEKALKEGIKRQVSRRGGGKPLEACVLPPDCRRGHQVPPSHLPGMPQHQGIEPSSDTSGAVEVPLGFRQVRDLRTVSSGRMRSKPENQSLQNSACAPLQRVPERPNSPQHD